MKCWSVEISRAIGRFEFKNRDHQTGDRHPGPAGSGLDRVGQRPGAARLRTRPQTGGAIGSERSQP